MSFRFRIWFYPKEQCYEIIETWFDGLECDGMGQADYFRDALGNCDLREEFGVRDEEHRQVYGHAAIRTSFDHLGEYDEEIVFDKIQSALFVDVAEFENN